jgi:hypothetical protein
MELLNQYVNGEFLCDACLGESLNLRLNARPSQILAIHNALRFFR